MRKISQKWRKGAQADGMTHTNAQKEKRTWYGRKWEETLRRSWDWSTKGVWHHWLLPWYRKEQHNLSNPSSGSLWIHWNSTVKTSSLLTNWYKASSTCNQKRPTTWVVKNRLRCHRTRHLWHMRVLPFKDSSGGHLAFLLSPTLLYFCQTFVYRLSDSLCLTVFVVDTLGLWANSHSLCFLAARLPCYSAPWSWSALQGRLSPSPAQGSEWRVIQILVDLYQVIMMQPLWLDTREGLFLRRDTRQSSSYFFFSTLPPAYKTCGDCIGP